jgi:alpha-acetolactate decarboxylase
VLPQRVDATVPSTELFYAIRVDGLLAMVTTRTAARQTKPYPGWR